MTTITVTSYFGKEKQVTREDFVSIWVNHVGQMVNIAETAEDMATGTTVASA